MGRLCRFFPIPIPYPPPLPKPKLSQANTPLPQQPTLHRPKLPPPKRAHMGLIRDDRNLLRRHPAAPNETRYHHTSQLLEYGVVDGPSWDGHGGFQCDEECDFLDG